MKKEGGRALDYVYAHSSPTKEESMGKVLSWWAQSTDFYAHSSHTREKIRRYYIGGHRALTDVSPASQAMRCRTPISNGEASGWASHAEGGNVGQAPVTYS